jgi:hypothetical protein
MFLYAYAFYTPLFTLCLVPLIILAGGKKQKTAQRDLFGNSRLASLSRRETSPSGSSSSISASRHQKDDISSLIARLSAGKCKILISTTSGGLYRSAARIFLVEFAVGVIRSWPQQLWEEYLIFHQ